MSVDMVGRPVRAGDAERDEAVSFLAEHFAAGRLTKEEYDERVDTALAAVHRHDLMPLFADLPGSAGGLPRPAPRGPMAPRPYGPHPYGQGHHGRRPAGPPLPMFLVPILVVLAIAVVFSTPWVLFVGIWLLVLGGGRFSAYRSGRSGHRHSAPGGHWRQ